MSRRVLLLLSYLACLLSAPESAASELSGVATLTSEYIYRGRSASSGDPAIQFGLDYEHDGGVFAGVWASTIDLRSATGERDTELDYYVGFNYAFDAPVSVAATLVRYTYPGHSGPRGYDYNELLLTATLDQRYSLEFGYTNDYYGRGWIGRHWEVRGDWPVADAWVISGGVGYTDLTDFSVPAYLHWDVGASTRLSRLTVDLRWYDAEQPDAGTRYETAGSRVVLSLSTGF